MLIIFETAKKCFINLQAHLKKAVYVELEISSVRFSQQSKHWCDAILYPIQTEEILR